MESQDLAEKAQRKQPIIQVTEENGRHISHNSSKMIFSNRDEDDEPVREAGSRNSAIDDI